MSYYNVPVAGRARRPFTDDFISLNWNEIKEYRFIRLVSWRKAQHAIFAKKTNGSQIMQSLKAISFLRCKRGEESPQSKLSNIDGISIFERANAGEDRIALAKEFGVSEGYVRKIARIEARVAITMNHINGIVMVKPDVGTVARPLKNKKLSPSLAAFIRKDSDKNPASQMHLSVEQLSKKYCVSKRTIQRILKGDMYKPVNPT
jgi:hypothetical protein